MLLQTLPSPSLSKPCRRRPPPQTAIAVDPSKPPSPSTPRNRRRRRPRNRRRSPSSLTETLAGRRHRHRRNPSSPASSPYRRNPSSPSPEAVTVETLKYNMFMAQMGCAAIGVLAFSFFGPGWLARSTALSVSLAFMIYARAVHPPAASLPLLFIDGAKFHHLKFWYILFPGAAGCLLLCLIQEVVCYLKDNVKF